MMKRILTLLLVVASAGIWAQTQPGSLRGVVKDKETGDAAFNIEVRLMKGEEVIKKAITDFDGRYNITPITPGTYDVMFVGGAQFQNLRVSDVSIRGNSSTPLNAEMTLSSSGNELEEVNVTFTRPLIQEEGGSVTVIDQETINNLSSRSIGTIQSVTASVFQADEGTATFTRGSRADADVVFIDGVKVRGGSNVPRAAIDQVEVITGGTPAQYGDAVGGITNITTRGPAPEYFGGVELLSSSPFLDWQHYNLAALTLGGPIWKRGERTVVGFLLATEFEYQYEPRPFGVTPMRVREDVLSAMEETPLRPSNVGQGVLNEGNFLRSSDLEEIPARLNVDTRQVRVNGSVNILTSQTTSLVLGGRFNYSRGMNGGFASSLMNWNNNSESIGSDISGFARFTQSFQTDSSSSFQNIFYSVQVDYTRNNRRTWDPIHQDNVFRYGHIGNFTTFQQRFYTYTQDEQTGITAWVQQLFQDTAVHFNPSEYNPVRSNYTSAYYRFVDDGRIINNTFNLNNIRQGGGLINGDNPESIYGLFQAVGTNQSGYNRSRNSQFRVTAQTTFQIVNKENSEESHYLTAGFEFEQRIDRGYGLGANGLWTQMRLLQNQAILQLDLDNPILVYDENGVFQDTINYNRAYDPGVPRTFDRNVRSALGLDPNGTDWVDIDAYDPDFFSLDMFSADELVNVGGTQYVSYFGYDYLGNIQSGNPTLNDFFTARDENGNFTRPIAAFQPLYIAGYIQDRFSFRNLNFNVGVRIDRFDANQPVLKDPYTLYPARTAGEVRGMSLGGEIPNSIGDEYVVYVNDVTNPTAITGYRDGDQWFDAQGDPLANPKDIADISGGQAQPYVIGATSNGRPELTADGFEDYTPQVTFSPRVSFRFPITDEAAFFAHYDILVQRPSPGLGRFNPFDYMQLDILNNSGFLANPNLLPQRTTDYEIGFQQVLTKTSVLNLSAFYKEQRDLIQTVSINEAYPITYVTYGNRDFSTVKGFIIGYELRRTNNLLINANYTLQFADGSGSGPNSGANLARSGQPNLRYILPLDFDTRHQVTASIDYRYGSGRNYNGPVWWNTNVFSNAGVNFLARASSGTPYSARVRAFELTDGASGVPLDGQINGSRQPWIFAVDMTVNKAWDVGNGQTFEVYVAVLNLFDTRNVLNVYAFTGAPDDDGWLASPQGQTSIAFRADAQSYADLYNVAVNSPFNYTLPRRIRLGLKYNF